MIISLLPYWDVVVCLLRGTMTLVLFVYGLSYIIWQAAFMPAPKAADNSQINASTSPRAGPAPALVLLGF